MTERIFEKEIPSIPDLLPELEEFILDVAAKSTLNKDKYNSLALSFSEAASNSLLHGNKLDPSKKIKITVKLDEHLMTITIKDEGRGFKLEAVPDPTRPENILKESGRGIHIMRSFLKDLRYNFTPTGTETILTLALD